jgi:uncharacterized protein (DUF983 family)
MSDSSTGSPSPPATFARGASLRCPAAGSGSPFRGWFRRHDAFRSGCATGMGSTPVRLFGRGMAAVTIGFASGTRGHPRHTDEIDFR